MPRGVRNTTSRSIKSSLKLKAALSEKDEETGELTHGYCRKCQQVRSLKLFYVSYSFLDGNGKMSVCKDCMDELYQSYLKTEHTIEKAVYKMCKTFDIKYEERAIEAAKKHIATGIFGKGGVVEDFFGMYKMKLLNFDGGVTSNDKKGSQYYDLGFQDSPIITVSKEEFTDNEYDDLRLFWGKHIELPDIEFLENEYTELKKTHKVDTYAEIKLAKEVCFKVLEIQKNRIEGKTTGGNVKELQEIMKNLAISPNMANAVSEGKSLDAYGLWIKDVEQLEPADWYKDRKLFQDVDNLKEYGETLITRPLRNFITGSRDFTLEMDAESNNDDEDGG